MKTNARQHAERRGRRAELLASLWLRLKGYRILEMRYRCVFGEVDIVARRGGTLVIVEVKQRNNLQNAHDALHGVSIKRIEAAGSYYQEQHENLHELCVRLDAVFILPRMRILHLKDAWRTY